MQKKAVNDPVAETKLSIAEPPEASLGASGKAAIVPKVSMCLMCSGDCISYRILSQVTTRNQEVKGTKVSTSWLALRS